MPKLVAALNKRRSFQKEATMTLDEAKNILGDSIQPNGNVEELRQYKQYYSGDTTICLDADFSADELEALAIYMRATAKP
jgi:hypothetical protein